MGPPASAGMTRFSGNRPREGPPQRNYSAAAPNTASIPAYGLTIIGGAPA